MLTRRVISVIGIAATMLTAPLSQILAEKEVLGTGVDAWAILHAPPGATHPDRRIHLQQGDIVRSSGSTADVLLGHTMLVRMARESVLQIKRLSADRQGVEARSQLLSGHALVKVDHAETEGSHFAIQTANSLAVTRDAVFLIHVSTGTGLTRYALLHGKVEVSPVSWKLTEGQSRERAPIEVMDGQGLTLGVPSAGAAPVGLPAEEQAELQAWSEASDLIAIQKTATALSETQIDRKAKRAAPPAGTPSGKFATQEATPAPRLQDDRSPAGGSGDAFPKNEQNLNK